MEHGTQDIERGLGGNAGELASAMPISENAGDGEDVPEELKVELEKAGAQASEHPQGKVDIELLRAEANRLYPMILRVVVKRMHGKDMGTIEDVVQESFLRASRFIGKLREPKYLGPWLYKIAITEVRNHFRKGVRWREEPYEDSFGRSDENGAAEPPNFRKGWPLRSGDDARVHELEGVEMRDLLLRRKIRGLTEDMRTVLILRYLQEMKFAEIAQLLKRNESTVKVQAMRGMDILKAFVVNRKGAPPRPETPELRA